MNAADLGLASAIHDAVAAARDDAGADAVVIAGVPGCFCAGVDTRAVPAYDADTRAEMLRTINRTILALYSFPKPLVAAVSGHALGAGLVLAPDRGRAARGAGPLQARAHRIGGRNSLPGVCPLVAVRAELAPDVLRVLALGSASFAPDSPLLRGVVDRVVEPAALRAEAVREAETLARHPGHAAVKKQLRAGAVAEMRRIVEEEDEPMLRGWVSDVPAR